MPEQNVSIDEFLNERKGFVKSGDILLKASKSPSSWNPETRSVHFVMSAEVEDRDRDIVFQAGLGLDDFLKNPIAPLQHRSTSFPVGTWQNVGKNLTGRPRRTEGDLVLLAEGADPDADRLAVHIAAGTIRACSIGFIPKEVMRREMPEGKSDTHFWPGYEIRAAELVECSPVAIPANPAALAKMAADGDVYAKELIEDVLDNWVKNDSGLIMPRAEFEAAHKEATGERTTTVVPAIPTTTEQPLPAGEARSLIRRALDAVLGPEADARAVQGLQEILSRVEAVEQVSKQAETERVLSDARKAVNDELIKVVDEAETRLLARELSALDSRLAAKGISGSAS